MNFMPAANALFLLFALISVWATLLDLPGNLVIFLLAFLYGLLDGFAHLTSGDLVLVFALFLFGELAEAGMGAAWAKKEKASKKTMFCAFLGAVAGGIFGTMLLPLAASVLGVLLGCFSGAYLAQYSTTKNVGQSFQIAKAVLKGQIFGIILKCTVGVGMIVYCAFNMSW